jgi:hypothetical protein
MIVPAVTRRHIPFIATFVTVIVAAPSSPGPLGRHLQGN